jgi:hypothetical protein
MIGDGFYEPRNSTLYMFSDRMNGIHRVLLPTFERLPTIPSELTPGELRYDRGLGQGVACGHGIGTAISGDPYGQRYLADGNSSPIEKLSMTWGCDWDPVRRKVYSTIPNLGLLDRIDYDTGRVEKRWLVGLGMRRSVRVRRGVRSRRRPLVRRALLTLGAAHSRRASPARHRKPRCGAHPTRRMRSSSYWNRAIR